MLICSSVCMVRCTYEHVWIIRVTYFVIDGAGEDGAGVCSTVGNNSVVQGLAQCYDRRHKEECQSTRQSLPQVRRLRLRIRHQASARKDRFDSTCMMHTPTAAARKTKSGGGRITCIQVM